MLKYILIGSVILVFLIVSIVVYTHKELSEKPVLTNFMVSQLPFVKRKSAEFLIKKGHLKVAPPLYGRKIVSRVEADQRFSDLKEQIRIEEQKTKDMSRMDKFNSTCRLLIQDFYNLRSIARERYMMSKIFSTYNFKYSYDGDRLLEVKVTTEYAFIPIQQGRSYNNDLVGKDIKDFLFYFDGENWMIKNMIDFS